LCISFCCVRVVVCMCMCGVVHIFVDRLPELLAILYSSTIGEILTVCKSVNVHNRHMAHYWLDLTCMEVCYWLDLTCMEVCYWSDQTCMEVCYWLDHVWMSAIGQIMYGGLLLFRSDMYGGLLLVGSDMYGGLLLVRSVTVITWVCPCCVKRFKLLIMTVVKLLCGITNT
jgi:hypothetical protein